MRILISITAQSRLIDFCQLTRHGNNYMYTSPLLSRQALSCSRCYACVDLLYRGRIITWTTRAQAIIKAFQNAFYKLTQFCGSLEKNHAESLLSATLLPVFIGMHYASNNQNGVPTFKQQKGYIASQKGEFRGIWLYQRQKRECTAGCDLTMAMKIRVK